jgi:hypothetical protein
LRAGWFRKNEKEEVRRKEDCGGRALSESNISSFILGGSGKVLFLQSYVILRYEFYQKHFLGGANEKPA